jgi:hypothetical protein
VGSSDTTEMTSREFLYRRVCESSAGEPDCLGNRWLAPETTMRTDRIIVDPALATQWCINVGKSQLICFATL